MYVDISDSDLEKIFREFAVNVDRDYLLDLILRIDLDIADADFTGQLVDRLLRSLDEDSSEDEPIEDLVPYLKEKKEECPTSSRLTIIHVTNDTTK